MTEQQPDLFGLQDALDEWRASLLGPVVPAPYDMVGRAKGEPVQTWVCPWCGATEFGAYVLEMNHGYSPARPGQPGFCSWTREKGSGR